MRNDEYNYLFVSDLHIASGVDPEKQTYHPREDFYYDLEFFRFLIWADKHPENGKKWELVFNGDCFDFLPVQTKLFDYQQFKEYVDSINEEEGWDESDWDFGDLSEMEDWDDESSYKAWDTDITQQRGDIFGDDFEIAQEHQWMRPALSEFVGRQVAIERKDDSADDGLDPVENWENRHGFLPTPGVSRD